MQTQINAYFVSFDVLKNATISAISLFCHCSVFIHLFPQILLSFFFFSSQLNHPTSFLFWIISLLMIFIDRRVCHFIHLNISGSAFLVTIMFALPPGLKTIFVIKLKFKFFCNHFIIVFFVTSIVLRFIYWGLFIVLTSTKCTCALYIYIYIYIYILCMH